MRFLNAALLSIGLLASCMTASADQPPLDCSKRSLAQAVSDAHAGDLITFTGVCTGPVVVGTDRLTLTGVGNAVIDGGGQDALTLTGAHGVSLSNFEVRNGIDGIVGVNGAHLSLTGVSVHDNFVFGITLETSSSALLAGVTA